MSTNWRTAPTATYRWGLVIPGETHWRVWRWYGTRVAAHTAAREFNLAHYAVARKQP